MERERETETKTDTYWFKKIDSMVNIFGLKSDADASRFLGLWPEFLSEVKAGKEELDTVIKFKILHRMGLQDLGKAIRVFDRWYEYEEEENRC
jgi:hypothetical protein